MYSGTPFDGFQGFWSLSARYIAGGTSYPLHCFCPLISLCGSRCGSNHFQDANEGRASDGGQLIIQFSAFLFAHKPISSKKRLNIKYSLPLLRGAISPMPEIFDSGIISIQITRWQLKSTQPHFLFQNRTAVSKKHSCIHTFFITKNTQI